MRKIIYFLVFLLYYIGYAQVVPPPTGFKRVNVTSPAAITITNPISTNSSNLSSPNGTISFQINGGNKKNGTIPYDVAWTKNTINFPPNNFDISPSGTVTLSNLDEGTYTAIIKDDSCPKAQTITFTIYKFVNVDIKQTNIKCKGATDGSIVLDIKGGSGEYDILWDNELTTKYRSGLKAGTYTYTVKDKQATGTTAEATINGMIVTGQIEILEPITSLQATLTKKHQPSPGNNDGVLSLNVSGGYGNYSYDWKRNNINMTSPPISSFGDIGNLGNGEYQVTVIDKGDDTGEGCPVTSDPVTLKALTTTINITKPIKCIGDSGALEAITEGGTGNYTYEWYKDSPPIIIGTASTLTGAAITKGSYKVIVTDDNDEVSDNKNLAESTNPPILISTTNSKPVNCYNGNDGAIQISVSGGTAEYIYKWNNSQITKDINNLSAGKYSVTVTDAIGCINTLSNIEVLQPLSTITIPSEVVRPVSINGQSTGVITFLTDPTGGNGGYTYNWTSSTDASFTPKNTKNISGLKAGLYTLTITDSKNCSASKEYEVKESELLTVNLKTSKLIKCNGDSDGELMAEAKGGIAPYKYVWTKNGAILSGENTATLSAQGFGQYSVYVSDSANPEPAGPFVKAEQLNYTLTQPDKLSVSLTKQSNVLCYSYKIGAIEIDIKGGTAPYTQQWTKDGANYSTAKDLINLESGPYNVTITDAVGHNCKATLPNPVIITQPTAPLLITDIEVKDLSGFETQNGSIKVEIKGGTSPYKYTFGNQSNVSLAENTLTLNKLPIGSYTLTITDANGCTTSNNYNLTQPDKLVITAISQTPASTIKCYGDKAGILEATITGGVLPYTYNWHNVLTPTITTAATNPSETLVAGTYELKVIDANGNAFTLKSDPIIEPPLLKINSTPKNVSCKGGNDGAIIISPSGGTGTAAINWSTGKNTDSNTIDNLLAASYSVTITDKNQCQASETIQITEPELLYVSKITKNPPSALGLQDGSIEIQVNGGTPNYNYLWYNGRKDLIYSDLNQPSNTSINNIFAGQYFVTVKDANGCAVVEKDLDKIDPLVLSVVQINIVKCNGEATASIKAIASGGTPIYYYKWYKTTDPLNAVGQSETLTSAMAGTYYVVLSDSFGLTKQSENITITEPVSLNNTLSSEFTRCGDAKDWTITAAPTGGTAPYTYLWNTADRTADLQNLVPAKYSVLVTDNHGCSITKNITITAPIHLATAETITKPTCFEGSDATIVLTSSGGQGPYYYLWDTGEKSNILGNASAKEYSVAVTDSKGCVINKSYTIENPPKDVISLGEDVTLCFDQSLTINSTIADDKAKYSWTSTKGFTSNKPIITVSEPADYTLVVTNKLGCKATDTVKISSQNTAVSAEFAVSSQVFANEKFIIVDISNPIADSIEWALPAEAIVVSKNKDFAELSFTKAGEYELTLNTKKGNCTATQTKKIVVIEGEYENPDSTDLKKNFDLKIYPNPSNGIFTVDVTLDKAMPAHVKVYNLSNNLIIDSKYQEGKDAYKFDFSLSGLTPGVYFVLVESQQGNQLRKIIIN